MEMVLQARVDLRSVGTTELIQQENFLSCIRNNVTAYGGGIACLKEQLANADDAGASHVIVCLDKSYYDTKSLLD